MTRKIKVDLSGDRPLIRCDGEIVDGVARAEIYLEPNELPLLVLMINLFDVEGGSLPHGWEPGKPSTDAE